MENVLYEDDIAVMGAGTGTAPSSGDGPAAVPRRPIKRMASSLGRTALLMELESMTTELANLDAPDVASLTSQTELAASAPTSWCGHEHFSPPSVTHLPSLRRMSSAGADSLRSALASASRVRVVRRTISISSDGTFSSGQRPVPGSPGSNLGSGPLTSTVSGSSGLFRTTSVGPVLYRSVSGSQPPSRTNSIGTNRSMSSALSLSGGRSAAGWAGHVPEVVREEDSGVGTVPGVPLEVVLEEGAAGSDMVSPVSTRQPSWSRAHPSPFQETSDAERGSTGGDEGGSEDSPLHPTASLDPAVPATTATTATGQPSALSAALMLNPSPPTHPHEAPVAGTDPTPELPGTTALTSPPAPFTGAASEEVLPLAADAGEVGPSFADRTASRLVSLRGTSRLSRATTADCPDPVLLGGDTAHHVEAEEASASPPASPPVHPPAPAHTNGPSAHEDSEGSDAPAAACGAPHRLLRANPWAPLPGPCLPALSVVQLSCPHTAPPALQSLDSLRLPYYTAAMRAP